MPFSLAFNFAQCSYRCKNLLCLKSSYPIDHQEITTKQFKMFCEFNLTDYYRYYITLYKGFFCSHTPGASQAETSGPKKQTNAEMSNRKTERKTHSKIMMNYALYKKGLCFHSYCSLLICENCAFYMPHQQYNRFLYFNSFYLFLLQGNKGNPGPVGPPGMKGEGFPGPQVRQTILCHLITFIINV